MKLLLFIMLEICCLTAGSGYAGSQPVPKVLLAQVNTSKIEQVKAGKLKMANASWWGFNKDDATDCLQNAINSGVFKLIVDNTGSDWIINKPLNMISNQEIVFSDGVVIQAKKDCFHGATESLIQGRNLSNITLQGEGKAVLRMRKADYQNASRYTKAEWRSGISLENCTNVILRHLTVAQTGGDGLYLGATGNGYNKNVLVEDMIFDDNHRQGVSVISVDGLTIRNSKFINTSGTAPQAGIDFEPNSAGQRLANCLVEDSVFFNNAGDGIDIYAPNLNSSSQPISITFNRCKISGNTQWGFASTVTNSADSSVKGSVAFNACTFDGDNILLRNAIMESVQYIFKDCVLNFNVSPERNAAFNSAPIVLETDSNITTPVIGRIDFGNFMITGELDVTPIKIDFWQDAQISDQLKGHIAIKQGKNSDTVTLPDYMRQHQKDIAVSPSIKNEELRDSLLRSNVKYIDATPEQTRRKINELELSGALINNLAQNGSFIPAANAPIVNVLQGWSSWQTSYSHGTFEFDGNINHGKEAGGTAVLTHMYRGSIGQNVNVEPGGTYVVRGWMRRSGMGVGALSVGWKDAAMKWLYGSLGPIFYARNDSENRWIQVEGIVTVPHDAHVMYISCGVRYQRFADDKIWFDDVAVYKIEPEK